MRAPPTDDNRRGDAWRELILARRQLARAGERYRDAIAWYMHEGGTYTRLGRLLGVSRQAASQHVRRLLRNYEWGDV